MTDATVTTPAPRKRHGWLRILAWIVGIFIVLLVVVYFVATSAAFLKGVILPKVSASLDAKVTVSDASISPFKQVILRDLKVQTTGTEPLVVAPELRLRYSLMSIIGGRIKVEEVALVSPTISLVENPDGTRNLDPIMKKLQAQPAQPKQPSKPSKPAQIDIQKISLSNGTISRTKLYAGGKRDLDQLSNVNLELANLKNGGTGRLTLGSDIKVENNPPAPQTNGLLQAKLNGSFDLSLTSDLKPGTVQGSTRLEVTQAQGSFAQAATFGANLNCNVTPTEIKEVALRFQKADTRLGELLVSGPFNMEKTEGRLSVQLLNIDKNLLNLAGASSGLDFGPTKINSTNQLELTNAGAVTTVAGQFNLSPFQVTRTNQTSPPLDLRADYNLTYGNSNLLVRLFTVSGNQKGKEIIHGELSKPMTIPLGNAQGSVAPEEAAFNLAVNHLDLADWRPFAGDMAPSGDVNAKLQILSQQGGKQITFDLSSDISSLAVLSGTNQITGLGVTLALRGQSVNTDQFSFPQCQLQVARQNQPLLTVSGSATYQKSTETADAQVNAQVALVRLLQAVPMPDTAVSSGNLELKTHLTQKQTAQNVTGSLALTDLTGRFGSNVFQSLGTTADFDVGLTPQEVQIRKVTGKLLRGTAPGGTFDLTGTYGRTNQATMLNANLANFNENGLGTFLQGMLGEKKLVSVALNGSAVVQYQPKAASSVKAALLVTNLVVNDPKGQIPPAPLAARMQLDAGMDTKDVAEIRQAALGFTPTQLATNNEVRLTGSVDMSNPKAMSGNLKLAADALDLTTYYDLFATKSAAGQTQPTRGTPQPAPAPSAPSTTQAGPATNSLPLSNFVAEASIGGLYLHEVQITNFQTTVKINGGKIDLNPFKFWLNGAPVNTTINLDLGVPGYKYDVAASAQAIPLAPLVNTFEPDRKGQLGGTLTADAKITGIGTEGEDLKKNLAGNFYIGTTNLNLSVINIRSPLLKTLINVVAMIPELAKNPENALGGLVSSLVQQPGAGRSGGLAGELEKSPLDKIVIRGSMGGGKVMLQQAMVQSPAFQADATGTITLESILTNSAVQIPVSLSLSRSVAQRLNLVQAGAGTNDAYAKLPDFVTMRGTVGQPKTDINKLALAGTVFKGLSGVIPGGGGQVGSFIQGLTGGTKSSGTNAPATNRPPANVGNLLQGLLGGGQSATNRPAATNAPATNQSPVGNILNNLFGPKK